jgi:diphthamide synthase (EF-2-diphthine--ammonia ligase)
MREAVTRAVREGFTQAAFGDLFLEDIRQYRVDRLKGTGLEPVFPLFDATAGATMSLARKMIAGGLRARITCLNPETMDRSFAGREFDETLLSDLPRGIDPCGERGEFHTCSYAGPMFNHPIHIETGEVVERDGFVFTDLTLGI